MSRLTAGFALTSLALILASCGSSNAPVATQPGQPAPAGLVKFQLAAPPVGGPGSVRPQGLTSQGLTDPLADVFFNVRVRDAANQLVAFNGGTYDPTGQGTTTVVLSSTNSFQRTLLLPAGEYSFENALKDTDTSSKLLAYGPKGENTATISADNAAVRLKFHSVFDKSSSALDFSAHTAQLFTGSTFNLSLRPRTSLLTGVSTTDIGKVTYTLGNPTDGTFNGAGSKIGVNVTAGGTDADSILNVTASFDAWIRTAGTDTASFVPTTLTFANAIETRGIWVDLVAPVVTFASVSAASEGSAVTLSGTATDDVQIGGVRVYADSELVASSVAAEATSGVGLVTTEASGNWSASWTPSKAGISAVSVVASDSSGNESREDQDVTVGVGHEQVDLADGLNTVSIPLPANGGKWIKVNRSIASQYYIDIQYTATQIGGVTATYGTTKMNQTAVPESMAFIIRGNTSMMDGAFYIHLTNSTNQAAFANASIYQIY